MTTRMRVARARGALVVLPAAISLLVMCWVAFSFLSLLCCQSATSTLRLLPSASLASYIVPLVVALGFWCVGVALPPRSLPDVSFLCLVAAGLAAGDISGAGSDLAARSFYILLAWFAPAITGFYLALAARPSGRNGRFVLSALSALATLETLPPLFYSFEQAKGQPWFGVWHTGVRLTVVAVFLVATAWLRGAYPVAPVGVRRHIRFVAAGTALGFAPLLLLAVVPDTLNAPMWLPYNFAFPWLLFCPVSLAYSRLRHRLVRVEAVFAQALVLYLNLILAVGLSIALTWLAVGSGLFVPGVGSAASSGRLPLGVLASFLLVCVVIPFQPNLRQTVHWILYGQEVPAERILAEFSQSLGRLLDPDKLCRFLTADLLAALGFSNVTLFIRDPEARVLRTACGSDPDQGLIGSSINASGGVVEYLRRSAEPKTTEEIIRGLGGRQLGSDEMTFLKMVPGRLWVPLVTEKELQGSLIIDARPDDTFFTAEDRRILERLSTQAGVAAYNIRLVGEVRAKGEEVARAHRQVLIAREQERLRLARELHDGALQQILGVNRLLEVLGSRPSGNGRLAESRVEGLSLENLREELLTVARVLREVSGELRPAWLRELGLPAALQSHFGQGAAGRVGSPRIILDIEESETELSEGITIALFRIAQEAVRNALTHAAADQIELALRFSPGEVVLTVRDDGRGFDPPSRFGPLVEADHFGLVGMTERAELVGGALSIRSRPGHGTKVIARVPLEKST